jgi:KaiC/GvpD/RAD55 family RecA-like ATPase
VTIGVETVTSPFSYLPFAVGALLAVLVGAIVVKKIDKSSTGIGHLEELMGGPIPRSSSVLLLGDPGSGKSIFCYQFMYDELENGRHCTLLSYDVFPEDVQARMKEFGWEITSQLRKARLKIIDCYSGLAGEGEGAIKDPSDLTELNIRVTSIISRAKGAPVTLVLDSLAPIFNGVEGKQAVMFLQTVSAKIKKTGGIFYMTGPTGAIPADSLAKIRSMVDGLIELSLVRENRRVSRYLTVVKMERRRISSEAVPFEIDRRKGIVFQVSRVRGALSKIPGMDSNTPNVVVPKVKTPTQPTQLLQPAREGMGILARLKSVSDKFWQVPSSTILDQKTIPRTEVPTKDVGVKDNRVSETLDPRDPKLRQESARTSSPDVSQNPTQFSSQASANVTQNPKKDLSSPQFQGSPSVITLPKKDAAQPLLQATSSGLMKNPTQPTQANSTGTTLFGQPSFKLGTSATPSPKQDLGRFPAQPNTSATGPPKKDPGQPSPQTSSVDVKENPSQDSLQASNDPINRPKKSKPQNPKT